MAKETLIQHSAADYNIAVQTIKDAILRSQYQAAKLVNREMLSLYWDWQIYFSELSERFLGDWGNKNNLRKTPQGIAGAERLFGDQSQIYENFL